MLKFSEEQMRKLVDKPEKDQSIPKLRDHLLEKHPHSVLHQLSDDKQLHQVKQTVEIAKTYDLRSQGDVYNFATLELILCPGFYQHSKVQEILSNSAINPDAKMLMLADHLPVHIWAEVF